MTPRNQARIALRMKIAARDITITKLAKKIGKTRETVSRAVNQGRFPRVLEKLKEALGE